MSNDKYLFSNDGKLDKKLNEGFYENLLNIAKVLEQLFGRVTMNQVKERDMDYIYDTIAAIARMMIQTTEFHYSDKSFKDSQKATANMVKAALAGAALKTGE